MIVPSLRRAFQGSLVAKKQAKKRAKPKSRPPRPDKMPGPIKYKKATGDSQPSMLEVASMRKPKKITEKPR